MASVTNPENILTLSELLISATGRVPNEDALVFPDSKLSFSELHARAKNWAKAFMALGIKLGDHVGLLMTTQPEFVEALFGAAMAGAATVPINARYAPAELAYLIENADLAALVTTDKVADAVNFIERLNTVFPDLSSQSDPQNLNVSKAPRLNNIIVTGSGAHAGTIAESELNALAARIDDIALDERTADISPEDLALILYTSGTTSNPKGCLIKHSAMVSNSRALGRYRYQMVEGDRFWSPYLSSILPVYSHLLGLLMLAAHTSRFHILKQVLL